MPRRTKVFPINPKAKIGKTEFDGMEAYAAGDVGDETPEEACPFCPKSAKWKLWVRGWHRACAEEYPDYYR